MTTRNILRVLSAVLVFGAFTIGYIQANNAVYRLSEVYVANLGLLSGLIALAANFLPSIFGNSWPRPEDQNTTTTTTVVAPVLPPITVV